MVGKIVLYGSPTLRVKFLEVSYEYNIQEDTETLFETLQKSEGVGLSGVQIGRLKRIL